MGTPIEEVYKEMHEEWAAGEEVDLTFRSLPVQGKNDEYMLRIIELKEDNSYGYDAGLYVQSSYGAVALVSDCLEPAAALLALIDHTEKTGIALLLSDPDDEGDENDEGYGGAGEAGIINNVNLVDNLDFDGWEVNWVTTAKNKNHPSCVQIGCNWFSFAEIRRIAEVLGVKAREIKLT